MQQDNGEREGNGMTAMTDSQRRRVWAREVRRCRDEEAEQQRLKDAEARLAALLAWADVWTRASDG